MANETITGKIFTLKDPTGTYNRFPRTVMEAVYGLNTYLQNQFSSLADIYMPIEGITESKPLQEFVYRLCPSSIKAKSLMLDRIYGKTLAWNQTIKPVTTQDSITTNGITIVRKTDGTSVISGTATADTGTLYLTSSAVVFPRRGHKVYVSVGRVLPSGVYFGIRGYSISNTTSFIFSANDATDWTNALGLAVANGTAISGSITVYPVAVDLTLLYGSAIDGMTNAQILAKFESEYPGYHDYSAGKLISNDAESIETVGFNQWDEEMVSGILDDNGEVSSHSSRITTSFIPVISGETYYFKAPESASFGRYAYYDANKNLLTFHGEGLGSNTTFTVPENARYIRICPLGQYGTTYNHDICINLSDPAKNGTYEPYRKSTMQLNLGSFQVRDGQGNVTTITGGLKSAGTVKDEIVGNKYIKRVGVVDLGTLNWVLGSVDYGDMNASLSGCGGNNIICQNYSTTGATYHGGIEDKAIGFNTGNGLLYAKDTTYSTGAAFKVAMNGVMLYYELATPIEYELVSPLVPTVKAGETEARISPNADGLSAPMVADMTYDANANNDSASAQYALTAGRLLNSHKLWGQDFDGTQDVAGALTGVTNINSLLYLGSSNVGIGQSNPQYKLDVSGTARVTGAVTLGSTLSVAGNTTVGGTLGVSGVTTITTSNTTPLTIGTASASEFVYLFFKSASTNKASVGYHNGLAFIANEHSPYGRIGVTDDGTPQYWPSSTPSTAQKYTLYHSGNSNKTDVPWSAQNITLNGEITGATSINSSIILNGVSSFRPITVTSTYNKVTEIGIKNGDTIYSGFGYNNGFTFIGREDASPYPKIAIRHSDNAMVYSPDNLSSVKMTVSTTGVLWTATGVVSDGYITAGAAASSSDAALKSNIAPVANSIETIMALKPSEWIWNEKHFLNGEKGAGLVAQEVEKVLPFAVAKEGEFLSLNYNVFHAYEIAGLQNHEERIKALEAENAELRRRLGA